MQESSTVVVPPLPDAPPLAPEVPATDAPPPAPDMVPADLPPPPAPEVLPVDLLPPLEPPLGPLLPPSPADDEDEGSLLMHPQTNTDTIARILWEIRLAHHPFT